MAKEMSKKEMEEYLKLLAEAKSKANVVGVIFTIVLWLIIGLSMLAALKFLVGYLWF